MPKKPSTANRVNFSTKKPKGYKRERKTITDEMRRRWKDSGVVSIVEDHQLTGEGGSFGSPADVMSSLVRMERQPRHKPVINDFTDVGVEVNYSNEDVGYGNDGEDLF